MTHEEAEKRCDEIVEKIENAKHWGSWMAGVAAEHDSLVQQFRMNRKFLNKGRID